MAVKFAAFLGAKSYSMLSPVFSLDQTETNKSLDKLQTFIDAYPNSTYLAEANAIVQTLSGKIQKKVYENAKGYHTVTEYKAAIVALDNFVADYPGTPYKEDALFYKYDSAYQLGINSVPYKMEEHLPMLLFYAFNLVKFKADTKYKKTADEMLARIETDLKKFTK